MKKILYLLCSFMVALTSCDNALEDVYDELDQAPNARRAMAITLTNANYESLRGKEGVPSYVNTGYYFMSEKQAGQLIPLYLNASYSHLANNDVTEVTYNTAAPSTTVERIAYTVEAADYTLGGSRFANFDAYNQIETFLNAKFPTPLEGRLVTLTYTWFNNNTLPTSKTVTDSFFYANGKWYRTFKVTNNIYNSVDRNRNNAFIPGDEVSLIPGALNNFLKDTIVGPKVGDLQYATYMVRYSATSTLQEVLPMFFNGVNWVKTYPATLGFVKKNGTWVADPIIKYSLTSADYTYISELADVGTAGARANLASFKNFYQRFTDNANYWPQDQIVKGLGLLLDHRFPDAPEGQKYEVTYIVHTGPTGPASIVLQKQDGKFTLPIE